MLRLLVATLLLANGLYLGWSQGWFAPLWQPPRHAEREPGRLAQQVRPEALVVLSGTAASAAVQAARSALGVCLQAGPYSAETLAELERALAAARLPAGSWRREPAAAATVWWLAWGPFPDAAVRRARAAELARRGLSAEPPVGPLLAALRNAEPSRPLPTDAGVEPWSAGFVLGRHESRAAAEAARATLPSGVRVLEVSEARSWVRLPRVDPDQIERLRALAETAGAGGFNPCDAVR